MSYLLQHGYGIVPGTSNVNHLKFNAPQYLISSFLQIASSNNTDVHKQFIQYSHPDIAKNNSSDFIDPNQGVITTFFNGLASKSIKLFLISANTNGYPIPVTIWVDPGKSKRVLANPNDVYVAYDGHGNAIKKFWISQENGGEETFSIE